jgi:hypothetical protein
MGYREECVTCEMQFIPNEAGLDVIFFYRCGGVDRVPALAQQHRALSTSGNSSGVCLLTCGGSAERSKSNLTVMLIAAIVGLFGTNATGGVSN